jgi:hypothetical protein
MDLHSLLCLTIVLPTFNNYGGQLSLVNVVNNGDVNNHLFAIEIDTFRNVQYKDPSSSHVGVGVNGVCLIATYDFCETFFRSFFVNKGIFGAWIVYTIDDGTLKIVVQQLYNDIVNVNLLQFY